MAEQQKKGFTTVELVFIAILGVVFGIINNLIGIVYTGINAVNPTAALFFAPFGIVTLLAAYVVRKPGAAILAGVINGLVQFLAGNPAGLWAVAFGIAHGLGTELVFYLFKYKNWGWLACLLAAGVDGLFNYIVVVFAFGLYQWYDFFGLVWRGVVTFFTAGIEAGVLGKIIGDLLKKTGLLKSFLISKQSS